MFFCILLMFDSWFLSWSTPQWENNCQVISNASKNKFSYIPSWPIGPRFLTSYEEWMSSRGSCVSWPTVGPSTSSGSRTYDPSLKIYVKWSVHCTSAVSIWHHVLSSTLCPKENTTVSIESKCVPASFWETLFSTLQSLTVGMRQASNWFIATSMESVHSLVPLGQIFMARTRHDTQISRIPWVRSKYSIKQPTMALWNGHPRECFLDNYNLTLLKFNFLTVILPTHLQKPCLLLCKPQIGTP